MLPDYHIHSTHSCDARDSMAAICKQAIALGLQEIGFSEHLDLHPLDDTRGYFNPQAYWADIEACRAAFGPQLVIRASLELSEPHDHAAELQPLLAAHSWDYLLGSLHWVGDMSVFDPQYFRAAGDEAYGSYFERLLELVRHADFDILAHFDIAKRYGFDAFGAFDPRTQEERIRAVLDELARRGRALEVNSGTLRRPVGETSPGEVIVRWFHEQGGRLVCFGSDAHDAEHVGFGQQHVLGMLRRAGFETYASYEQRRPQLLPLPVLEG